MYKFRNTQKIIKRKRNIAGNKLSVFVSFICKLFVFFSVGFRYIRTGLMVEIFVKKIAHVSLSPQIKMKNRPCVEYPSGIETNQVNFLWKKKNIWNLPYMQALFLTLTIDFQLYYIIPTILWILSKQRMFIIIDCQSLYTDKFIEPPTRTL